MTIGEKIRTARMGREFTQKKLSEVCGVAEISIRNYENNKRQPTIEQLQKIAEGLQVNINYFFGASKPSQHAAFIDWVESLGYYVLEREDDASINLLKDFLEGCNLSEAEFGSLVKSIGDYTKFVIKTAIDDKNRIAEQQRLEHQANNWKELDGDRYSDSLNDSANEGDPNAH